MTYSLTATRELLGLSEHKYLKLRKLGVIERPIKHKGMHPFHTDEQIERAKERLLTPQTNKRTWERHLWQGR